MFLCPKKQWYDSNSKSNLSLVVTNLKVPIICSDHHSTQSNAVSFFTEIIHRVVMHEDPPFRPNIPCIEIKPEYIDLMVDCWNDDPEERPHFYRIVERLKKISGRYSFSLIVFDRDLGFASP